MRKEIFAWLMIAVLGGSCYPRFEDHGPNQIDTGAACATDANCDDANPCTTDRCSPDTLICVYAKQQSGPAPDSAQTPVDCKSVVCNEGVPSVQDDPNDFINDNNSCTVDACNGGMPTNEIMADGSACALGTKTGKCIAGLCEIPCVNSSDCDDSNPCSDDLCNMSAGKCVFTNLDGIPTPGVAQVVGDCKLNICENGLDVAINDDADVLDDNNPCTTDICVAGVPSSSNAVQGTSCNVNGNDACDGNGACKKLLGIACSVGADCISGNCVEGVCCNSSCTAICQSCNIAGSEGTCSLLPAGSQDNVPTDLCVGTKHCNGAGVCQ